MRKSSSKKAFERPAWTDRFKSPSIDALREGLRPQSRPLFDALRKRLLEMETGMSSRGAALREDVAWYGDCWHWSIEYRIRVSPEPLAVIVPSPQDLQLALPVEPEFTRSLPLHRMKRAVRDGLELAIEPYQSRWGVWSITGASLIDDLQDLVEMKVAHLAKRVG